MNPGTFLKLSYARNERGAVLVTGLLFVLVLTILGIGSMMTTAMELKIAANDRSTKQAFYLTEGGVEDARSRLQASGSPSPIPDSAPTNPSWTAYIGTEDRAAGKGYQSSNGNHVLYAQLNSSLDYVVTITHKLNGSNILRWGDSNGDGIPEENTVAGGNIYVITSEGRTASGAEKTVQIEAAGVPYITTLAALYTEALTTIQGTSTHILGWDHCGSNHVPAVVTTARVDKGHGHPTLEGHPPDIPAIVEDPTKDLNIQYMVDQFKGLANYSYNGNSQTLAGMHWGSPIPGASQQDASSCDQRNVVHINTSSTFVRLSGGSSGCGLLLVEGDLQVDGGFQWYGVVLVTGSITFLGGGEKNVTGSMMAGGNVSDLISGDANIVYCSQAVWNQTNYLPLKTLRWVEFFS